jgi:hypothetical protein
MLSRLVIPAIVAASAFAGQTAPTPPVIGTISSTAPVTINGTEMSPSAAPSWPLASRDEISTSAPARLQTTDRDVLLLDTNSKVRISAAGNGDAYLYIRQGGAHFDARTGPIYVCIADHLYVPAKSAAGSLKLDASGSVAVTLERGAFAEQGTRACGQDIGPDFLSGLPKAAGGTLGPPAGGGLSTNDKIAIGVFTAAAASAPFWLSSSCGHSCNSNPPSISPSVP